MERAVMMPMAFPLSSLSMTSRGIGIVFAHHFGGQAGIVRCKDIRFVCVVGFAGRIGRHRYGRG